LSGCESKTVGWMVPKGCQTAARGHTGRLEDRGSAWCWTQIHSLSGLETVRIRSADPELVCADLHLGAAPPSEACGAGLLGSMAILFELSLSFFSFGGPVVETSRSRRIRAPGFFPGIFVVHPRNAVQLFWRFLPGAQDTLPDRCRRQLTLSSLRTCRAPADVLCSTLSVQFLGLYIPLPGVMAAVDIDPQVEHTAEPTMD